MPANFRKFDVKHGISVNGLPFVDENRNVTLNNLTVQGTSTIVDTRTVSQTDPIISIGASGKKLQIDTVSLGTPGKISFSAILDANDSVIGTGAEAFDDIAIGDSFRYNSTGADASPLVSGGIFYVIAKNTDVGSNDYRTITFSDEQGGAASAVTIAGSGNQTIILNPLQDLNQDLGIEFNYVDTTAKKGFFGYQDDTGHFTFLLDTTYGGSSSQSDVSSPAPTFTGTKSGIEVKYIKLEPTNALTAYSPGVDLDQTWNNNSITFAAIDLDIVDTNSAAESTYLNFALDSLTNFAVRKDGALTLGTADSVTAAAFNGFLTVDGRNNTDLVLVDLQDTWNSALDTFTGIDLTITNTTSTGNSKLVNFYSTDNRKYELYWDGHSIQEVEFTGGGTQTAVKVNVTDTSSAANSYLLDLQLADTSVFSVRKDGFVEINGPGEFHDTITIETQDPADSLYKDNTQLQTDHVNVAAGTSTGTTVNSMAAASFVTAKILVQVKQGSAYHSTELMLVHDGTNVYLTEYGTVYTSDIIGTFDASISGGNVNIIFTKTAAAVAANAQAQIRTTRLAMVA